jgi:hypothetical protein
LTLWPLAAEANLDTGVVAEGVTPAEAAAEKYRCTTVGICRW